MVVMTRVYICIRGKRSARGGEENLNFIERIRCNVLRYGNVHRIKYIKYNSGPSTSYTTTASA